MFGHSGASEHVVFCVDEDDHCTDCKVLLLI